MSKTAFVTGGTGFLGMNLLHTLCEQGWELSVLHRPSSELKYIKHLPIKLVEGSLTDKASLEAGIPQGTEVVFHIAGDTNMWRPNNDRQTLINVEGTRNLVEVAAAQNVKIFIHTSSVSAWGDVKGMIDESVPQRGNESWINYEKTKWAGEQAALKGRELGLKVVVINPAAIVGPRDIHTWGQMFFALKANKIPGIPAGNNSYVHVDDVVAAHIAAVDKGQDGQRYIVSGENAPLKTLVSEIAQSMGISKIPRQIPAPLLKLIAGLSYLGGRIINKEPTITPEIADFMSRKDYAFDNSKALRELGYEMRPWREGVTANYEWLKAEALL
ncbi:MAG: NAD-dependent epimerase/dehydratase family protein [Bacteroidota bacterium]